MSDQPKPKKPAKPSLAAQLSQRRSGGVGESPVAPLQPIEPVVPRNMVQEAAAAMGSGPVFPVAPDTAPKKPQSETSPHRVLPAAAPKEEKGSSEARPRRGRRPGTNDLLPGGIEIDMLYERIRNRKHLSSATFRYQAEELKMMDEIFAALEAEKPDRISKNDIARLAMLWLCEDYKQNGEQSVLDHVFRRL